MKKYTTILILLMLTATALAQRTEQREQKGLLILPSRDGRRQSQREEKIQELRQFAKELDFTEILNNRNYDLFSFSKNWQFTHVTYLKPQVDAEHTSDGIGTVTTEIDSIGHQERLRFKMMNDSVRSAFLNLAPSANNVDMYEFHKNGVDTIRYVLQFNIQPNSSTDTTRSNKNIESLKYTFSQGPTSDKQTHLYRADLVYNYYEAHKRTAPTLDTLAFQTMLDQAIEPLIKRKMAERFPIEWRFDRNYQPREGEIEWKGGSPEWYPEEVWRYGKFKHMGLVSGVRYFIPKKYEQEELALFHTIDSLTLDFMIQHPTTEYSYNGIATSPLMSTSKDIIIVNGLCFRDFAYCLLRHTADDGVHYLFMITPNSHRWYPSNFNKLRKWENGVGTPLPTPTTPPSPTFLYSTHSNVTVQEVRQTKDATTLVMNYQGSPYGLLSISSSTRLVDEQGQPVPITDVDEFALDSTIILPQNGKMDFTLHFKPLPKGTRIFDLIEGQRSNEFRIYGITDGTQRIKIPVRTEAIDPKEVTEASLSPDSVCIRGHIANYDRRTMPRLIHSLYHIDRLDCGYYDSIPPTCCRIDSLGYFTLSFQADHAVWNHLELVDADRILPFMVHPGDTLQIDIDNYGQWNEQVSYTSRHGQQACNGLMHLSHDLMERYYPETAKKKETDTFQKEEDRFYKGKSRFYDYIVWKYRLTPWEAQLLGGNLSMNKALNHQLFIIEQKGLHIQSLLKIPKKQRPPLDSVEYQKPEEMAFLKEVNWNDPSLAFQFYWPQLLDRLFATPLHKFQYDTIMNLEDQLIPSDYWDAAFQKQYRQKLLELFPNMAPNLVEDYILNKAPWIQIPCPEDTYTSPNPVVQHFIASLLFDCKSELLQLLFIDRKNALDLNKWYNTSNFIKEFSDNPQLSFILVVEGDAETLKQEQGLRNRFPSAQIRFVPTETFLELCEGCSIWYFLGEATVNSKGQLFKPPLTLSDERSFRRNLKRLQEALAKSAKSSQ